jgi:prepilin-type N-terminal cleavage/methylation domain-containing protein
MKSKSGFTIVETLIVLAVTSVLLISALSMINGRQGRTQFSTGLREIESILRDTLNDVNNGVLPAVSNLECDLSGNSAPILRYGSTGDTLAKNEKCVLAGKAIQLGNATENDIFTTYYLAGRRLDISGDPVKDFVDLRPVAIHPANSTPANDSRVNATQASTFPWGITPVLNNGNPSSVAFALVYKDFRGAAVNGGSITSGNSAIGLVLVSKASTSGLSAMTETNVVSRINSLTAASFLANNEVIPICLKSGTSDQYAIVSVSISGTGYTVSSEIVDDISTRTCS